MGSKPLQVHTTLPLLEVPTTNTNNTKSSSKTIHTNFSHKQDKNKVVKLITLGKELGRGQQGKVFQNAQDNKKVVKLRTFNSSTPRLYEQKILENNALKLLNEFKILGKAEGTFKVEINKNTLELMQMYPSYFLEAFMQHRLGAAGLAAQVHQIFATEENSVVHIYIVMERLKKNEEAITNENKQKILKDNKQNLLNIASLLRVQYQNGASWGLKNLHVMIDNKGKRKLIDLGNSRFMTPKEHEDFIGFIGERKAKKLMAQLKRRVNAQS